jgi:hypothetical protein
VTVVVTAIVKRSMMDATLFLDSLNCTSMKVDGLLHARKANSTCGVPCMMVARRISCRTVFDGAETGCFKVREQGDTKTVVRLQQRVWVHFKRNDVVLWQYLLARVIA